ncbi:copper chaperone PCu(A)C [Catellatospora sp. NPDC049111]|uniref:copper chaperone PCu(A)C n=1 Tax=Catellatospora sp. NPDC049111 TaxID=3155271 RepID=UPI0033EDD32E
MRPTNTSPRRWRLATALAVAAAAVNLAGCAPSAQQRAASPVPSGTTAAAAVTVRDPWVKAADNGMSAAFGTLVNNSASPVTVVAATSAVAATVELHEVADVDGKMVMRPKPGGFTIPAGGTHELAPGADHLMMIDLATPVKPGDTVTVRLTLADGSTTEFTAIGKQFAAGNETYSPTDLS